MSAKAKPDREWPITTRRLVIRPATPTAEDIDFLYRLWTNPDVMRFVGYPQGLRIDPDEIEEQLQESGPSEYDRVLLVHLRSEDTPIGECKLGSADKEGIAHTDVKIQPIFRGNGYGREIKQALVNYLFTHTECRGVSATPNRLNAASIKMQEAVGAKPIREGVHRFPESMKAFTADVSYIEYVVWREDWDNSA